MHKPFNPFADSKTAQAYNKKSQVNLIDAIMNNNLEQVKESLEANQGDNVNSSITDNTPIMTALSHASDEIVEELFYHGANLQDQNRQGSTVAHIAAQNDNVFILEQIKEFCPKELEKRNKKEETPIFTALKNQQMQTFQFLIQNNVETNHLNKYQKTLLDIIHEKQNSQKNEDGNEDKFEAFEKLITQYQGLKANQIEQEGQLKTKRQVGQKKANPLKDNTDYKENENNNENKISGLSNIKKKRKNAP